MHVDRGDNFHDFGDKNIFYVLFVWPNHIKVYGDPNFLYYGVGVVLIKLTGYHKLHTLDTEYWTSTDRKNTL